MDNSSVSDKIYNILRDYFGLENSYNDSEEGSYSGYRTEDVNRFRMGEITEEQGKYILNVWHTSGSITVDPYDVDIGAPDDYTETEKMLFTIDANDFKVLSVDYPERISEEEQKFRDEYMFLVNEYDCIHNAIDDAAREFFKITDTYKYDELRRVIDCDKISVVTDDTEIDVGGITLPKVIEKDGIWSALITRIISSKDFDNSWYNIKEATQARFTIDSHSFKVLSADVVYHKTFEDNQKVANNSVLSVSSKIDEVLNNKELTNNEKSVFLTVKKALEPTLKRIKGIRTDIKTKKETTKKHRI